jgi:hypothetical protein
LQFEAGASSTQTRSHGLLTRLLLLQRLHIVMEKLRCRT